MKTDISKIYVACSLTQAPESFKTFINDLKKQLRLNYRVMDFVGLDAGTPEDVFKWDMYCVTSCDLLLADCSYPSIGLGMELGMAFMTNKPIIAIAQKDAKVTRMLLGMQRESYHFFRYNNVNDIVRFVKNYLHY